MNRSLLLAAAATLFLATACGGQQVRAPRPTEPRAPEPRGCALIATDDDIPSGSATAGALYLAEAALGKRLLTADVVAVARGFLAGGLPCVRVLDSHGGAIDPAPLRRIGVEVLTPSGTKEWTWPFIGPTPRRIAMAALVGYHSPAGARGFRPHTINDSIQALRINGETVGEVAHMILGLGAFEVPVVLVSGDMNATAEAAALVPDVEKVTVRWLGKDGEPRFLTSGAAARRLHDAARRAAQRAHRPYRARTPVRVELETHSARLMAARHRTLGPTYRGVLAQAPAIRQALAGLDFRPAVDGRRLTWVTGSPLAAYVTIAFAASHLRVNNWDKVTEGYKAYTAGRYQEALVAYRQALEQNPADMATRCRLGAAHQKLGQLALARRHFAYGVEHMEEVGGVPMKTWCALGLAQVAHATGDLSAARAAALKVLALPDFGDRHRQAREILGGRKP